MATETELQQNRTMIDKFVLPIRIPDQWKVKYPDTPFGYIYCIENVLTKKKYIGSTYSIYSGIQNLNVFHAIYKRASMYLYEYNKARKNQSKSAATTYRPIVQGMLEYGFNGFVMYPIAETTRENHISLENHFINLYDTIKNGYNVEKASSILNKKGYVMSAQGKALRSQGIICVNLNEKKLIISQSMKLFADYINSSKDMIKNSNRKGRSYKGWFIFYLDKGKRGHILSTYIFGDGLAITDRHSEKSKSFYKHVYDSVSEYVDTQNSDVFPGFKVLPELMYAPNQ